MQCDSEPAVLIVVAPNSRLGRSLAEPSIRLRSLDGLKRRLEKHPAAFVLLEWKRVDGETSLRTIEKLRREFPDFRLAVFCPELPELPGSEAESLRFFLLEAGATAVFGSRRELNGLSEIVGKQAEKFPRPTKDRIQEILDSFSPPLSEAISGNP